MNKVILNTNLLLILSSAFWLQICSTFACTFPGYSLHSTIKFEPQTPENTFYPVDTLAIYSCDDKYDLIGPKQRICSYNNTWLPIEMPFCAINVAKGQPIYLSSQLVVRASVDDKIEDDYTVSSSSSSSTASASSSQSGCRSTDYELNPWWSVELTKSVGVRLVKIEFAKSYGSLTESVIVTVKVGQNPAEIDDNFLCDQFVGLIKGSIPLFFSCSREILGNFVNVHLKSSINAQLQLSICEVYVYTNHGKFYV